LIDGSLGYYAYDAAHGMSFKKPRIRIRLTDQTVL